MKQEDAGIDNLDLGESSVVVVYLGDCNSPVVYLDDSNAPVVFPGDDAAKEDSMCEP